MTPLFLIVLVVLQATGHDIGSPIAGMGMFTFALCVFWDIFFLSSRP